MFIHDDLSEIANTARTLAQAFPDNAKSYGQARDELGKCDKHDPMDEEAVRHFRQILRSSHKLCLENHNSLDQLVRLCDKHLPEVMATLHWVDKPGLRFDDTNVDWDALTTELRRIDKAARAKREEPDEFGIRTEPLTLEQLRQYFEVGKNNTEFLESINGLAVFGKRYRVPVSEMPTKYHVEKGLIPKD